MLLDRNRDKDKRMYELRLNRKLTDKHFKNLSKEARDWIVNAIGNLVVVDGTVEEHELFSLQEAIGMLDTREEIENMLEMVKQRKLFKMEPISLPCGGCRGGWQPQESGGRFAQKPSSQARTAGRLHPVSDGLGDAPDGTQQAVVAGAGQAADRA